MASRATVRVRSSSSKTTMRPRPCSLAWYMAVSASRTRLSALSPRRAIATPMLQFTQSRTPRTSKGWLSGREQALGRGHGRDALDPATDEEDELVAPEARHELVSPQRRREARLPPLG